MLTRRTDEGEIPAAAIRLELAPLSLEAARQIVGDAHAAELHQRSGGNAAVPAHSFSNSDRRRHRRPSSRRC